VVPLSSQVGPEFLDGYTRDDTGAVCAIFGAREIGEAEAWL